MVGGLNRRTPPRDLTRDPEAWPEADLADAAADAVQHIARTLAAVMAERELSLRKVADRSGVNRQVIADLLAGRSWPDVATVARLGAALDAVLWPKSVIFDRETGHEASIPARSHHGDGRA